MTVPEPARNPENREPPSSRRWQMWAAVIVALGCIATVAYTIGETFWG
jgi:hypothetical protein